MRWKRYYLQGGIEDVVSCDEVSNVSLEVSSLLNWVQSLLRFEHCTGSLSLFILHLQRSISLMSLHSVEFAPLNCRQARKSSRFLYFRDFWREHSHLRWSLTSSCLQDRINWLTFQKLFIIIVNDRTNLALVSPFRNILDLLLAQHLEDLLL